MPLLRSWVASANDPATGFPLNNLPYGAFQSGEEAGVCVAIGDRVLDLSGLEEAGLIHATAGLDCFFLPDLTALMEEGAEVWAALRAELTAALAEGSPREGDLGAFLRPMAEVEMLLPFTVSGYTDFYAGRRHATNVGTMFRGAENALPPNWLHIPIGYNGRASSVVVSGTEVRRPLGQLRPPGSEAPVFGPSRRLDIELEMGAVVGQGSALGQPVTVAEAEEMIFGFVLLNDWSARDIQAWEYQPLGPFQAKAFATTISPWVVTAAALAPFRVAAPEREVPLLPYLEEPGPGLYDIALEVEMTPARGAPAVISRTNARELYYSAAQQLAHHAVSGCPMRPGDLLGSGTISGPTREAFGSLLEISWGGKEPLEFPGGVTRSFLEDGDEIILRGHAAGDGYRIGFGECRGRILPAPDWP
ncbi:MAG: fumarylacetoacetase [Pseudomonadota bacterium]